MKAYRNNLFLPVLMHLLLFIYPTLEKVTHQHVHEHEEKERCFSGSSSFSAPEEECAICDFQFVTFIAAGTPQLTGASPAYAVFRAPSPKPCCTALVRYFHLRAPPSGNSLSSQKFV